MGSPGRGGEGSAQDFHDEEGLVVGALGAGAEGFESGDDPILEFGGGEVGVLGEEAVETGEAVAIIAGRVHAVGDAVGGEDEFVADLEIGERLVVGHFGVDADEEVDVVFEELDFAGAFADDDGGGAVTGIGVAKLAGLDVVNEVHGGGEAAGGSEAFEDAVEFGEHGGGRSAVGASELDGGLDEPGDEGGGHTVAGDVGEENGDAPVVKAFEVVEVPPDRHLGEEEMGEGDVAGQGPAAGVGEEVALDAAGGLEVLLDTLVEVFEGGMAPGKFAGLALLVGLFGGDDEEEDVGPEGHDETDDEGLDEDDPFGEADEDGGADGDEGDGEGGKGVDGGGAAKGAMVAEAGKAFLVLADDAGEKVFADAGGNNQFAGLAVEADDDGGEFDAAAGKCGAGPPPAAQAIGPVGAGAGEAVPHLPQEGEGLHQLGDLDGVVADDGAYAAPGKEVGKARGPGVDFKGVYEAAGFLGGGVNPDAERAASVRRAAFAEEKGQALGPGEHFGAERGPAQARFGGETVEKEADSRAGGGAATALLSRRSRRRHGARDALLEEGKEVLELGRSGLAEPLEGGGFPGGDGDAGLAHEIKGDAFVFGVARADGVGGDVNDAAFVEESEGGLEDADVRFHAAEDDLIAAEGAEAVEELRLCGATEGEFFDGDAGLAEGVAEFGKGEADATRILLGDENGDFETAGGEDECARGGDDGVAFGHAGGEFLLYVHNDEDALGAVQGPSVAHDVLRRRAAGDAGKGSLSIMPAPPAGRKCVVRDGGRRTTDDGRPTATAGGGARAIDSAG